MPPPETSNASSAERASPRLRDYEALAVLRDGGSVLIRGLRPADKDALASLFRHLSADSIRHRVFGAKSSLSAAELAYLTEIDFLDHVAFAAVLHEGADERIVGVGRWCVTGVTPGGGKRAEMGFDVAEHHQGRGIGMLLLELLAETARQRGVHELEAYVMADNVRMMEVFATSGFRVERSVDAGVLHVTFPTSATDAFLRASALRERHAIAESMRVFFDPSSVAVVGASRRANNIGRAVLDNLRRCGFARPLYVVHPEATELDGCPCFSSVFAVPGGRVDLVVVAVPAPQVEQVLVDSARARARGVVVMSAGFAETGDAGRRAQEELRRLVRGAGMRLVGPNCMGVLNASRDVSLNATFAPVWPPAGGVSMLSQSGALGIAMLDQAARRGIGIAGFVSVGNKADVSSNDLLCYWADDPTTRVIVLYLESFGNPRTFARIAPDVARRKPIVAVKSGRSAAGTRAAASHSAALASVDVSVDALFEQAGVIRTNTLEELFDVTALLSTQPLPAGPRVGVVTNAGGPGILFADACEARGLRLPELDDSTLEALRASLPRGAGLANPIDMIASASPEDYARTIEAVGRDPNVDSVVVIYIPPLVTKPEDVARAIAAAASAVPPTKPIAAVFMSSPGTPTEELAKGPRGPLPSYTFPENAALALAAADRYARWRERPRGAIEKLDRETESGVRRSVERLVHSGGPELWVPPGDLWPILELAGIAVTPQQVVNPDPEATTAAARKVGFPVVLKAVAEGLIHKSDVGGVVLNLQTEREVRGALARLEERVARAGYRLDRVVVQHQVDEGVEAIVGVTVDPSFGPLVIAGLGGVRVEVYRDVAIRMTPVSDVDAASMVEELHGVKLLEGFRGAPVADRSAFIELIERVSALAEVVPELLELELNPVKILARGAGVVAVDARMRLRCG